MRITEIEFGYLRNTGDDESQQIAYRATLEAWENAEESLNTLRNRVARELNLPDQWYDLKHKFARQIAALEAINSKLEAKKIELVKAEMAWDNFREFLVGHGVDPTTLTVENFHKTRAEHSPSIEFDPLGDIDESNENHYALYGCYPEKEDGECEDYFGDDDDDDNDD